MTNEEVEGKVLTVHEGVHGVSDDLRHHVGINVTVVFVVERCSGQHHTDEISGKKHLFVVQVPRRHRFQKCQESKNK